MTKFSNHPHNKSHSIAHSQSQSHHSGTKAFTHRSPVAAQQQKLLHQQTKSKHAAVKTFKSPTVPSEVSLISLGGGGGLGRSSSNAGLSLCGVSGALAGLIPANQSQAPPSLIAASTTIPTVASMSSVLDRFKAASTPTHTKKSIREQVVEKLQTVLTRYHGKLGIHIVIGFNSIQRLMERDRMNMKQSQSQSQQRLVSMIVIAKDCKEECLHFLIKSALQQRIPYLILPSFSNMLREACQVKSAFCFAVRSEYGLQQAIQEYKNNEEKRKQLKEENKKRREAKKKLQQKKQQEKEGKKMDTSDGDKEDKDDGKVGMSLEDEDDESNAADANKKYDVGEQEMIEQALEAAVDDLRDYLTSLIETENAQ